MKFCIKCRRYLEESQLQKKEITQNIKHRVLPQFKKRNVYICNECK